MFILFSLVPYSKEYTLEKLEEHLNLPRGSYNYDSRGYGADYYPDDAGEKVRETTSHLFIII